MSKKLTKEELEKIGGRLALVGDKQIFEKAALIRHEEAMELIRLARLGFWAQEHGAKALDNTTLVIKAAIGDIKYKEVERNDTKGMLERCLADAEQARAKLPKS